MSISKVFYRIGALSGASSIGLGAIGAHKLKNRDQEWKDIWTIASRYHQFGSLALIATASASIPTRARLVGGSALLVGTTLFSGANYLVSYYEDRSLNFSKAAPIGGGMMMVGFVALAVL